MSVKLQEPVALDVLVDAIDIVDCPCVLVLGGEQGAAKCHILAAISYI